MTKTNAKISPALFKKLLSAAKAARAKAYAPYSRFHVGVALVDDKGRVFAGGNCETANYKSTCAERAAITAMTSAGGRRIRHILVLGPAGKGVTSPCGSCRQDIREFAGPGTAIHLCRGDGRAARVTSLDDLLPDSFGPEDLKR